MSGEDELSAAVVELQAYKQRVPSATLLRRFMKLSRETRLKNSETVAYYGAQLLKHHRSSMGEEELWLVHEQVAIAGMDCGAMSMALALVKALLGQFPDSLRAKRLQGMFFEASGRLQTATELYEGVLDEQPTNQEFAKRLVALAKTRGDLPRAIELLTIFLDHYMNDKEAWEELVELYLQAGQYRQAAFAMEELITLSPANPNVYVRYADVLCTLGGKDNLKTARAYYSRAITGSTGRSTRALHGLLACHALLGDKDGPTELAAAAAEQLLRLYREAAPDKVPALEACLKAQALL